MHHLQPSPSSSWVAAATQPCYSGIFPFCIFQPILLGLTWYCFLGVRALLPTLFEPYISISMYWYYFCSSASYKLRSHSLGLSICSSVLHFLVHVLLRLALPGLSDHYLKNLYTFATIRSFSWLFGYSYNLCIDITLLLQHVFYIAASPTLEYLKIFLLL